MELTARHRLGGPEVTGSPVGLGTAACGGPYARIEDAETEAVVR